MVGSAAFTLSDDRRAIAPTPAAAPRIKSRLFSIAGRLLSELGQRQRPRHPGAQAGDLPRVVALVLLHEPEGVGDAHAPGERVPEDGTAG
jgi:hypothetical protein